MTTEFVFKEMRFRVAYHILGEEEARRLQEWSEWEVGMAYPDHLWLVDGEIAIALSADFHEWLVETDEQEFNMVLSDAMEEKRELP